MARLQEHREDVVAVGALGAAAADLVEQDLVGAALHPREPEHIRVRHAVEAEGHAHHELPAVGAPVHELAQRRAAAVEPVGILDAEDGAHDHLERDRLRVRHRRHALADRPARELLLGRFRHEVAVALHPLAVERRQHELALAHVRGTVEQQHGAAADDRPQDRIALARVQHVGAALEDLLDALRVGDHHPRPLVGEVDREDVAVPVAALAHEGAGPDDPPQRLPRHRRPRPGGYSVLSPHLLIRMNAHAGTEVKCD